MEWKINDKTKVLVVAKPERCLNYKYYDQGDKIDSRLQLLPLEYVDAPSFPFQIDKENGLAEGMMFVRHPFINDAFIDVNKLEDSIIELKLQAMKSIGLKLGAKDIHIECELESSELRAFNANADASWTPTVTADVKANQEKYSKRKYTIDWKNNKTPMTLDSYNKAIEIAREFGLYSEPRIATLFKDRNPEEPATGTFTVCASALKESNDKLEIAVSASYLSAFSFKANVANSCTLKNEITLVTTFTFE